MSQALQAFRQLLGTNDMLAYLTMMAPRLVELRRVLKPQLLVAFFGIIALAIIITGYLFNWII